MKAILDSVVDELQQIDWSQIANEELHYSVRYLQKNIDRLAAIQAELLFCWNSSQVWADDGSLSAGSRLANETGLSSKDANRLLNRARKLNSMNFVSDAFGSGTLSSSRADLLCGINRKYVAKQFARDEEILLNEVQSLKSFDDANRAMQYWLQLANDEAATENADHQFNNRRFSASRTYGGVVELNGTLDPINGEIVLNEMARLERQLFLEDCEEAKRSYGEAFKSNLKRTSAQRRADALVLMAKRSAGVVNDDGVSSRSSSTSRPLITVVLGLDSFEKVCELASGTVITPSQVVPLLTKSEIERIVFNSSSRVIDVGRRQRFFPDALRRAIQIRDRRCQHPSGCEARAEFCETDHIVAHSRDGATSQENAILLCPAHNKMKGNGTNFMGRGKSTGWQSKKTNKQPPGEDESAA